MDVYILTCFTRLALDFLSKIPTPTTTPLSLCIKDILYMYSMYYIASKISSLSDFLSSQQKALSLRHNIDYSGSLGPSRPSFCTLSEYFEAAIPCTPQTANNHKQTHPRICPVNTTQDTAAGTTYLWPSLSTTLTTAPHLSCGL